VVSVKRTGIFFYYQQSMRLRDFPQALEGILERENVFLYDAFYPSKPSSSFDLEPISLEVLGQTHSLAMIEKVKNAGVFEGALLSASGTVRAAERIWKSEIDNAFVFTGYGDHHAGAVFFGGECYFNGAAIAIHELARKWGARRFVVIDTDAHHGDGSWDIFKSNPDILYGCFCSLPDMETNNNVNVHVPSRVTDKGYLNLIKGAFLPRARAFKAEAFFWNFGYDGTSGDYGDIGLTPEFHVSLAQELKAMVDEVANGRLIIVLCGGGRRDLARDLIPRVIRVLAKT
jgi:acetoin utilization deacetylase AcuC-like enzyme